MFTFLVLTVLTIVSLNYGHETFLGGERYGMIVSRIGKWHIEWAKDSPSTYNIGQGFTVKYGMPKSMYGAPLRFYLRKERGKYRFSWHKAS